MTDATQIRRLTNGAIDLAYYQQRGRVLRSESAHEGIKSMARQKRKLSRWTREVENPFDVPNSVYRECF